MIDATDAEVLRGIVGQIAHQVGGSATHKTLDDVLTQLGLPASASGGTKAERVDSSLEATPDEQLPRVARTVPDSHQYWTATNGSTQPPATGSRICCGPVSRTRPSPKRARREVARALDWDDLLNHYPRFRALLGALFVLDDDPFGLFTGGDNSLGARIDRHVHRNPDWTVEETFDALSAIDASDRRFALLLEGIVSGETVPDEAAQRRLVVAINPPLAAAGLHLRETGATDGYPVFELVATRLRAGRPKNLIFASPFKPDLRLSDAVDNDIEIVSNADDVLVYDRPIRTDGIRWRDLQEWWKATCRLDSDQQAKTELYRRLRQSLPADSPPQQLLFRLYYDIHREAVQDLPALLPEVWRHWDPKTVQARGAAALLACAWTSCCWSTG
jgi:AbiJ N-terminal domain 3